VVRTGPLWYVADPLHIQRAEHAHYVIVELVLPGAQYALVVGEQGPIDRLVCRTG
jgi:hypothetical protein